MAEMDKIFYDTTNIKTGMVTLPKWLDNYIFGELDARYDCKRSDLVVLEWDKKQIEGYLGTYFPRSFAEAYCIFSRFFVGYKENYEHRSTLSLFDFGCGTGGEIVGFIHAIKEQLPSIQSINIHVLDGNQHALRFLEAIIDECKVVYSINISLRILPDVIDNFYDMSIVDSVVTQTYDVIISFKAICEFVKRQRFEEQNPYKHFIETFTQKLAHDGILCIADITTYSDEADEWLPKMLDSATKGLEMAVLEQNDGYNEEFCVSHSAKKNDRSKIAWRIYKPQ